MLSPEGTIPIRRVTMEQLTRFRLLRDFFRKADPAPHFYAYGEQKVKNFGASANVNIWMPNVVGKGMSLSQLWCASGPADKAQIVEVGWQVQPQTYGDPFPHLFIYWTPDGYKTGCYNLCGAFVQTNKNWHLGGVLRPSRYGGDQSSLPMLWLWNKEYGWLLYLNWSVVGYYPFSIFEGGGMTKNAVIVQFGGETAGTNPSPEMGSGAFASAGYGEAAFQDSIYYVADSGGTLVPASLTYIVTSPSCYTTAPADMYLQKPGFYFGGPGGSC
jgi:hypothetical protein